MDVIELTSGNETMHCLPQLMVMIRSKPALSAVNSLEWGHRANSLQIDLLALGSLGIIDRLKDCMLCRCTDWPTDTSLRCQRSQQSIDRMVYQ